MNYLIPVITNQSSPVQLPKTWPGKSSTWISAQTSDTSGNPMVPIYICKAFYSNTNQNILIYIWTNQNYRVYVNKYPITTFIQAPKTLSGENISPLSININKGWNFIVIEIATNFNEQESIFYTNGGISVGISDGISGAMGMLNVGLYVIINDSLKNIIVQGDKTWYYTPNKNIINNENYLLTFSEQGYDCKSYNSSSIVGESNKRIITTYNNNTPISNCNNVLNTIPEGEIYNINCKNNNTIKLCEQVYPIYNYNAVNYNDQPTKVETNAPASVTNTPSTTSSTNSIMWIILIVLLLLLCCSVSSSIVYFFIKKGSSKNSNSTNSTNSTNSVNTIPNSTPITTTPNLSS